MPNSTAARGQGGIARAPFWVYKDDSGAIQILKFLLTEMCHQRNVRKALTFHGHEHAVVVVNGLGGSRALQRRD
jgi:hypothetical protein